MKFNKVLNDDVMRLRELQATKNDLLWRKFGLDIQGGKGGPVDKVCWSLQAEIEYLEARINAA